MYSRISQEKKQKRYFLTIVFLKIERFGQKEPFLPDLTSDFACGIMGRKRTEECVHEWNFGIPEPRGEAAHGAEAVFARGVRAVWCARRVCVGHFTSAFP